MVNAFGGWNFSAIGSGPDGPNAAGGLRIQGAPGRGKRNIVMFTLLLLIIMSVLALFAVTSNFNITIEPPEFEMPIEINFDLEDLIPNKQFNESLGMLLCYLFITKKFLKTM